MIVEETNSSSKIAISRELHRKHVSGASRIIET